MKSTEILGRYTLLLCDLESIVTQTEKRVTTDTGDDYFITNVNFLTKSFLISLCCYLESFLKDISHAYIIETQERIQAAKVPHNLVIWSASKGEIKDKDWRFGSFELAITPKDIDTELSGNPFRTANFFRKLGINAEKIVEFQDSKDLVNTVVAKRNNVIHHNDSAADISMGDILLYATHFKRYMVAINTAFSSSTNP